MVGVEEDKYHEEDRWGRALLELTRERESWAAPKSRRLQARLDLQQQEYSKLL